jgi:sugar O-acyltransferase (sialic acid O-acetyltransferase NeuD family)
LNRLLIVGAGGLGRELLSWAMQVPMTARDWYIGGVLDWQPEPWGIYKFPFKVLGSPDTFMLDENDRIIVAIGDPNTRLKVAKSLEVRGAKFTTVCHPTVTIGYGSHFGVGCMFMPGVTISTNVSIGDHVLLNAHSTVGHDTVIGDGGTLCGHVDVTGRVMLERGCFVGSHASVLPKVRVAENAVIGAGAIVLSNVDARTTVFGVPARPVFKKDFGENNE